MKDLKRIADHSNDQERIYTDCINEIPDENFDSELITECIGKQSIYILNDFDHLIKSVYSYFEIAIKEFIQLKCFKEAGTDFDYQKACTVFQTDVLDFLWNDLRIDDSIDVNKVKYLFEIVKLPEDKFFELHNYLKEISEHLYNLVDEAINHRDLTVERIQRLIKEKTVAIMQEAGLNSGIKPTIFSHSITITQDLDAPIEEINQDVEANQAEIEEVVRRTNGPVITIPDLSKKLKTI